MKQLTKSGLLGFAYGFLVPPSKKLQIPSPIEANIMGIKNLNSATHNILHQIKSEKFMIPSPPHSMGSLSIQYCKQKQTDERTDS